MVQKRFKTADFDWVWVVVSFETWLVFFSMKRLKKIVLNCYQIKEIEENIDDQLIKAFVLLEVRMKFRQWVSRFDLMTSDLILVLWNDSLKLNCGCVLESYFVRRAYKKEIWKFPIKCSFFAHLTIKYTT